VYSTRIHARIPNGHPREENRAACRTSRRGSSCVSSSWTTLVRKSARMSVSMSAPWNAIFNRQYCARRCYRPHYHGRLYNRLRPSVHLSVSSVTFEPSDFWPWPFTCVWIMTLPIALLGLKGKVTGQCQSSKIEVKGRNAVGGTSILSRGQLF